MKKRGRKTKTCGRCRDLEVDAPFCTPQTGWACLACKVAMGAKSFAEDRERKWSECNPQGQPYFVQVLGSLLPYENFLIILFGEEIVEAKRAHFDALLAFAHQEQDSYGFNSPEDFTLVRCERALKNTPGALDFWLSLCCAFDLDNYLEDYGKWSKKKSEAN